MNLCEYCGFWRRLLCIEACPAVNDILDRIDRYLMRKEGSLET